jgi:hypothetical protein
VVATAQEQRERERQALLRRLLAQNTADITRCKAAICAAFRALYPDATGGRS